MLGQPEQIPRVGVQAQHPPSLQRFVALRPLYLSLFFCFNFPSLFFIWAILQAPARTVRLGFCSSRALAMKNFISALGKELPGWFQASEMQIEGREVKYPTWPNPTGFITASRQEMEGACAWAIPGSIVSLFLFQVLIIPSPALRWSSWAWFIPSSFSCRTSRSRAGFMQGAQSHRYLIRKEQNVWQGRITRIQKRQDFHRNRNTPIRIHQITTTLSNLTPP